MERPSVDRIILLFFHGWGEFYKWKLNFLRWAAGLTTDVRENASAHGDNRSPLKVARPSWGERVRFASSLLRSIQTDVYIYHTAIVSRNRADIPSYSR